MFALKFGCDWNVCGRGHTVRTHEAETVISILQGQKENITLPPICPCLPLLQRNSLNTVLAAYVTHPYFCSLMN